jgi:queuosine precursor transporter
MKKFLNLKFILVSLYLVSIVLANLVIAKFGIIMTIPVSFILIGLDLTARDKLHELWHNKNLVTKMLLLIFSGSVLSYLLNNASLWIAIASFVAFLCSGIVDFIVYSILYKKTWFVKVNSSNVFSALTDSILFPTIAFRTFLPLIILGQFIAKTFGGFLWAFILKKK